MKTIHADVVIVGGGAAGCYAALNLKSRGIEPVILCKGLVGKSGASIFAGNLVLSGRMLGNTEDNARNTAEFLIKYHNQYLIDQAWARRCGQWIETSYYAELEQAGLYFRRDDNGQVVTSPGKIRSIAANVQGNSGVPFMDLRRKQVARAGIRTIEEAAATALIHNRHGAVSGVFCLDWTTGTYFVLAAKAVILATGYSDRFYTRATGTREMSGDGIALAWRAGASLVNMEMQWWHTNDVAHPPCWQRMQIYPNPMLGSDKSARMVNAEGDVFFDQQQDDPMAFGPYTVQLKRLVEQVRAGKARYDGAYYAGFDHCSAREVSAYTTYAKPFNQLGLPFPESLLETAVTAHYRQGGIDVDVDNMRTSVPGLYAAGGVAGHSNGLIGLVTYDGKVVAEGVAEDFPALDSAPLDEQEVAAEKQRLERLRRGGGRSSANGEWLSPAIVKTRLREVMWRLMGVEKSASTMTAALHEIEAIREHELKEMALKRRDPAANYEWLDAIDAINMADVCELVVRSALERKESRGPFMRTDFPLTDNRTWLAANVIRRSGNSVRFERRRYDLPVFRPDFDVMDNMEVPW